MQGLSEPGLLDADHEGRDLTVSESIRHLARMHFALIEAVLRLAREIDDLRRQPGP